MTEIKENMKINFSIASFNLVLNALRNLSVSLCIILYGSSKTSPGSFTWEIYGFVGFFSFELFLQVWSGRDLEKCDVLHLWTNQGLATHENVMMAAQLFTDKTTPKHLIVFECFSFFLSFLLWNSYHSSLAFCPKLFSGSCS